MGSQAILFIQKSIITTKTTVTPTAVVATTVIARHLLSLCYKPDTILSTLYLLTYLIITTTLCGRSAIIHGIYDLPKKGDPARSHPITATVRSPCPIAASCSFTWEAKLHIGDSAELRVRELGLNPGSASSLLCLGMGGQNI